MSRVVFVGNVPYNMGEDQLIDFFKQVGHVVGFRLVYDRETNKPRGYGFCEFGDHQTAQSAVRNLNGKEIGGRALRIDLADSDPFLEGRTTVRGEIYDGPHGNQQQHQQHKHHDIHKPDILKGLPAGVSVPPGMTALDVITDSLTSIRPTQMLDVLAQMKTYVTNYPKQAQELLNHNPQLSYAIFQALILNDVVDRSVIQRMQDAAAKSSRPPPTHTPTPAFQHPQAYPPFPPPAMPGMGMPHQMPPQMPSASAHQYMQPPPTSTPNIPPYYQQQQSAPVQPPPMYSQIPPQPQAQMQPQTQAQTQPPPSAPPPGELDQQRLLLQLLQLTPEQVSVLAPNDRAVIEQVRNQYLSGQRSAP